MKLRSYAVLGFCLAAAPSLLADFTYQETTRITGGAIIGLMKMASMFSHQARQVGEPITSTVYLKGNRMARVNQNTTQILDLDRETITEINHQEHTYTVMTFEQMRQQLEAAQKEAEKKRAQAPVANSSQPPPEMHFKANVRKTGATKNVAGLDASEAILAMQLDATDQKTTQTASLAITNDMWLTPEIPGYAEVRDFERRFALRLGTALSGAINPSMFAFQPGMGQGLADLAKEMSKLKGVPVLQVMRIGTTANGEPLPAASEAPLPAAPEMPSAGDVAQQTATNAATSAVTSKLGGLGSALGGFGGFGKKKKPEPAPDTAQAAPATPTAGVLIESNTELASFSSVGVDSSHFEVPSGYKEVKPKTGQQQ